VRILDLFCCAGGGATGYRRAFPDAVIVGVDIVPQPRYPYTFVQGDALTFPLDGFDLIHASPPCQAYSSSTAPFRNAGREYPDLLEETRQRLLGCGTPWVIENVPGSPMRTDLMLCGSMFGLRVRRHRHFEFWCGPQPTGLRCDHKSQGQVVIPTGRNRAGLNSSLVIRTAMDMPWANRHEARQAIPPAYTAYIGQLLTARGLL